MNERVFLDPEKIESEVKGAFNAAVASAVRHGHKHFIVMDPPFSIVKDRDNNQGKDKVIFMADSLEVDEITEQIGEKTDFIMFAGGVSLFLGYGSDVTSSQCLRSGIAFKSKEARDIVLSMLSKNPVIESGLEEHFGAADFVDGELKTVKKNIVELKPKGYKLN